MENDAKNERERGNDWWYKATAYSGCQFVNQRKRNVILRAKYNNKDK